MQAHRPMRECINSIAKGIELNHEARQLHADDFYRFDYIPAMDKNNYRDITRICPPDAKSKVLLMRHFDARKLTSFAGSQFNVVNDRTDWHCS